MIWASYGMREKVVALGKWEIIFFPIFGLNFLLSGNILIKRGNNQSRENAMAQVKCAMRMIMCSFPDQMRLTRPLTHCAMMSERS